MTSDSMSARPMIMARRMAPAADGLRAMPSHAAARPRPWPMAPAAAAIPSRNAAETRFQRTPPPAGAVSCANAETASSSSTAVITMVFLFTPFSSFVDLSEPELVLFRRRGPADVDHGQHDEDERLQKGP